MHPDTTSITISKSPFLIVDTPGTQEYENERKDAITNAIRDGVSGIINVVASGYHYSDEMQRPKIIKCNVAKEFLADRQDIELSLLSEWVPFINPKTSQWILTIVNKADLWWDRQDSVNAFYSSAGQYVSRLAPASPRVPHSVMPYCSEIKPYFGCASRTFGQLEQSRLRARLLQRIIDLTKRSSSPE